MAGFKMLVLGVFIQILATEQIQYPNSTIDLKDNDEHRSATNLYTPETTIIRNEVTIEDTPIPSTYEANPMIYLEDNIDTSLVSCANKIVDQYFTKNGELVTVFSYTEHASILLILGHLFRTYKTNVWTQNSPILSQESTAKSNNYIIMIQRMEELEKSIEMLQKTNWNPHAKILITSPMVFHNLSDISAQMAKILWKYKAMNAVYLLPNTVNSSQIDVYTWFPYANSACADNFTQTQVIEQCIGGKLQHATDLFATRVPKDLNQCLVKVQAVIWPPYVIAPAGYNGSLSHVDLQDGFEIALMKTIADELNLSIEYSIVDGENDCGYISSGGESFGLMHLVHTAQVDLALGAMATVDMRYKLLDPSVEYGSETLVFCVPCAEEYPRWTTMYHMYTLPLWCAIVSMYFVVSIGLTTIARVVNSSEAGCFASLRDSFFNTFATILSISIAQLPRSGSTRFLFFAWCIFSFQLTALYQSLLMRYLVKPLYRRQVTSVEEMLDFGTVGGSYFELKDITGLQHATDLEQRLLAQWTRCDRSMSECLESVAFAKNYSMAVPRLYMAYTSNRYVAGSTGKSLLYCFQDDESLLYYPIVLYGYSGLPFMKRINAVITAMTSSGVMDKWKDDLRTVVMQQQHLEEDDDSGVRLIRLGHLQGAFLVYTFGTAVSLGVFTMERIVSRVFEEYFGKSST